MLIYHYYITQFKDTQREEDIKLANQLRQGYKILSATPIFTSEKTIEIIYVLQKEN